MARNFWTGPAGLAAGVAALLAAAPLAAQIQAATGQFVYAIYDGQETGRTSFDRLREQVARDQTGAYAVVAKDLSGQVILQEQVGGALGRAVFLRGLTALLGPSTGQGEAGTTGLDTLRAALTPGSSGIFALVDHLDSVCGALAAVTGYAPGTDYEPGLGIEPGTGYTPGVGIQPDTADMPNDDDR